MRWKAWGPLFALLLAREASAQQASPANAQQASPASAPEVLYPPPRVKVFADLSFLRAPEVASICPDESWFRASVGAHMGLDSFEPNPRGVHVGSVRVALSRVSGGFAASYTWDDREGAPRSARFVTMGATRWHCLDALDYVVTSLYGEFLLRELHLGKKYARHDKDARPAAAPSCPTVAPCPESPYSVWPPEPPLYGPKPDPPQPPERWPVAVRFGVAAWPELIAKGLGSLGVSAEIGARYRVVSADVELHGDPPLGSVTFPSLGAVSFARVSGALLLCAHFAWFVGCGTGDAGRIFFPNHIHDLPASTLYGSAGVRVGLEFPVAPPRIFLRAAVDLRAPIGPAHYIVRSASLFESAGPGAGLGLGLVAELPP